jgi:hypothetical protein
VSCIPPSRPVSTTLLAQPISTNRLGHFPPPGHCQAGPSVSQTPHLSLSFAGGNRDAPNAIRRPVPSQTRPLPLLRLHTARWPNFGRSVTIESCPSAAPLRARCRAGCRAVWPYHAPGHPHAPLHTCAAAAPALSPHHQRSTAVPGAEGSPTNHGCDRVLMRLLGYH